MATQAAEALGVATPGAFARLADRWVYVFMAGFFVVTALVGFVPDSINMLAAVEVGQRPPLLPILHVHAILMGAWLLLLLAQTTLVATGRTAQHRTLGLASFLLLPAIVAAIVGLVTSIWSQVASIPAGGVSCGGSGPD